MPEQMALMLRTIVQALNHLAEVVPAAGPIRRLTQMVTDQLDAAEAAAAEKKPDPAPATRAGPPTSKT